MFSLMDRVPDGITPMLRDLEDHIIRAGLEDMIAAADCITTVTYLPSIHIYFRSLFELLSGKQCLWSFLIRPH